MSEIFVRWSVKDILLWEGDEKVIAMKHSYSAFNDLVTSMQAPLSSHIFGEDFHTKDPFHGRFLGGTQGRAQISWQTVRQGRYCARWKMTCRQN